MLKILVLQTTRLGDILYTVPVLSALKRKWPDAQVDVLVRARWADALSGLGSVSRVWQLDTEKILGPLILGKTLDDSRSALQGFVDDVRSEDYHLIINLSFSPSSSFLTRMISRPTTAVVGYTRTADGFLCIPDEASLYFKAQVGVEKSNRMHLIDIFGWIAGVQINQADWHLKCSPPKGFAHKPGEYVVIHAGASQASKTWPMALWQRCLSLLVQKTKLDFVMVGSQSEREGAEKICSIDPSRIRNLAGKTDLHGLGWIIKNSKLFIGNDSGPLQVANSVNKKSLCLSVGNVRFWETGPVVEGSVVLSDPNPWAVGSDRVTEEALRLTGYLSGPTQGVQAVSAQPERYVATESLARPDRWDLVRWLYFQGEKPEVGPHESVCLSQTIEVCELALHQLSKVQSPIDDASNFEVLARVDQITKILSQNTPSLRPLYDRFETEKGNIGPDSFEKLLQNTSRVYESLKQASMRLKARSQASPERTIP